MSIIEEINPPTVDALFELLRLSRVDQWGDKLPGDWIFRGQSDASWQLLPGVWRENVLNDFRELLDKISAYIAPHLPKFRTQDTNQLLPYTKDVDIKKYVVVRVLEELLLEEFEDLLNDGGFEELFIRHKCGWKSMIESGIFGALDKYAYIEKSVAIAQHSGVPTRFLDWTLDPIKALAFSMTRDNAPQNICIWCADRAFISSLDSIEICASQIKPFIGFVRGRRFGNTFLNAQDGCFTYIDFFRKNFLSDGAFPRLDLLIEQEAVRKGHTRTVMKKVIFELGVDQKKDVRKRLYRERKTLFHLMPSLERCAEVSVSNLKLVIDDDILNS